MKGCCSSVLKASLPILSIFILRSISCTFPKPLTLGKVNKTSQLSLSESLGPDRVTLNFQQESLLDKRPCGMLRQIPYFHLCFVCVLNKPLGEFGSQVLSQRFPSLGGSLPFRKKNCEPPKLSVDPVYFLFFSVLF